MANRNLKLAFASLRTSKWRSLMTMAGIIVGIVSVITIVSLGVGVKQQVVKQMNKLGGNLIIVRPGVSVKRDSNGVITRVNNTYTFSTGSLSENDLSVIKKTDGVSQVLPLSIVSSGVKSGDLQYDAATVIGTSDVMPDVLKQKVAYGSFFSAEDSGKNVAVIGKTVAEQLFHENVPLGMSVIIRGQEFIVRGIFDQFNSSPIPLGPDFNKAVFIPYEQGRDISGGSSQLVQVMVQPTNPNDSGTVIANLNRQLSASHGDQTDFTVLRQDEDISVTGNVLNLFTGLIAGIAAMSLLVGGIGIMNIMLASVSERTREIGIRKAVGATNRQILNQFLTEAAVLSAVGGIVGIILAYVVNFLLIVGTNLHPVITWPVVVIATGVSLAVGVIFGIAPAARAARKDPIDALRYE